MNEIPRQPEARLAIRDILKDEDYRFRLRLIRADPADFFAPWNHTGEELADRRRWIHEFPERHLPFLPEAEPLVDEVAGFASALGLDVRAADAIPDPQARWAALASCLEPDLALLTRHAGTFRMVAGAVCFPSSWRPEQKLGLPLAAIHDAVPGLNAEIGSPLDAFLDRLRPGTAWLRANWGLTASRELNQHPARELPRLSPPARLEFTVLRLEHQALLALPRTGGLLFGIRVEHLELTDLHQDPELSARLATLDVSDSEILISHPVAPFVRSVEQRLAAERRALVARRPVWRLAPAALAVTALVVAFLVPIRTPGSSTDTPAGVDGDRLKGDGAEMVVFLNNGAAGGVRLSEGALARGGDVIQVGYQGGGRGYGVIVSVDGRGHVTQHFPLTGAEAAPLRSGGLVLLDSAYRLDDAPRAERFFLVTSDATFPVDHVLSAARSIGQGSLSTERLPLGPPFAQTTFLLKKD